MSDYDDDEGFNFRIGLDPDNSEKPVYFSFELDDGVWEFWFSYKEIKDMTNILREILNDIELGVKYDSHH